MDQAPEVAGVEMREYNGDACKYLVPWIDENMDRGEIDAVIAGVLDYVNGLVPDMPDHVGEKFTFGMIFAEGLKRVQTVYTNDRNRWPKGGEYRDFVKQINSCMANKDKEGAKTLKAECPELFARWAEVQAKKLEFATI